MRREGVKSKKLRKNLKGETDRRFKKRLRTGRHWIKVYTENTKLSEKPLMWRQTVKREPAPILLPRAKYPHAGFCTQGLTKWGKAVGCVIENG